MSASAFIPKDFARVEIFQAREVFRKDADGAGWTLSAEHTTRTLRDQINTWLTETRHCLSSASPPNVNVFDLDDSGTLRCYLTSVLVCYIAATEGAADPNHERAGTPKPDVRATAPSLTAPPGLKVPGPQLMGAPDFSAGARSGIAGA